MASTTTELPISPVASKSKTGSDALEAEAIGLDVAVRVHGSQVAAVVLESTEHVEPFEEDTTTMIVFPRGAVVKLRARVRTGHAMVLTNLLTKQTALCRIIQVNTAPNVAHYVKLEFAQPAPGFWGVHFPSDPLPSARTAETPKAVPAPAPPAPLAAPVAPVIQTPTRLEAQPAPVKLPVRETIKSTPPRELNLSVPTTEYGNERLGDTEDLLPLASGSPSADRKALSSSRVPAVVPAKPKRESSPATEQPIFDSLTTQEEIFSREAAATHTGEEYQQEPTRQADTRASRKTIAAIDYSSLLQPASRPKRNSSVLMFAGAVVVVLAFVAAGAMYLRHNPKVIAQIPGSAAATSSTPPPSSLAPSSSLQAPAAQDAVVTANPSVPVRVTSSSTLPSQVERNADAPAPVSATLRNSIKTGSEHVSQKSTAATSRPAISISTGMADIYAGDLKAHAQIKPRDAARVTAPVPDMGAASSKEIPVIPNGNLGSLVSGIGSPNLVAPAPPKPDVVPGGKVQLPRLVTSVPPVYPQLAAANHVEGEVKIQAEINTSGKVTSTKVISGPILLRSAAVNALRQWKYSPAMLDGKAISTQYIVTVRFRLNQ
ncbi:MAG: energy transducer TonB [Candidatus Acidiferrales bacterium]